MFIDPLYRRVSLGYEKCCLEGAVASGGGEVAHARLIAADES